MDMALDRVHGQVWFCNQRHRLFGLGKINRLWLLKVLYVKCLLLQLARANLRSQTVISKLPVLERRLYRKYSNKPASANGAGRKVNTSINSPNHPYNRRHPRSRGTEGT